MDLPLVIGSDGSGIVTEIGEGVSNITLHTEVIINPSIDGNMLLKYQSYQKC